MILLFISIVGVVVGVFAAESSSISDPEALMLLGLSFIGVATCIRRKRGKR